MTSPPHTHTHKNDPLKMTLYLYASQSAINQNLLILAKHGIVMSLLLLQTWFCSASLICLYNLLLLLLSGQDVFHPQAENYIFKHLSPNL